MFFQPSQFREYCHILSTLIYIVNRLAPEHIHIILLYVQTHLLSSKILAELSSLSEFYQLHVCIIYAKYAKTCPLTINCIMEGNILSCYVHHVIVASYD